MKKIIFALIMGASVALAVFTPPDSGDNAATTDYVDTSITTLSNWTGVAITEVALSLVQPSDWEATNTVLAATDDGLQSQITAIDTNAIITASVTASATNNTVIYFEGGGSITFTNSAFLFDDGE